MRCLLVLSAFVACVVAAPGYLGGYHAAPTVYNSVAYSAPISYAAPAISYAAHVPVAVSNQYVAQDTLGQYSYGYSDGHSTKGESRGIDGSVAGGYSYVDGKGEVQKVQYTADSTGFHVAASNLPVAPKSAPLVAPMPVKDTPEVMAARAQHLSTVEEVKNRKVEVVAPVVAPVVARVAYNAPLVSNYAYAPAVTSYAYAPAVSGYSYAAPAISSYSYAAPAYTSYSAVKGYYAAPHTIAYSAPAVSYAAVAPIASVSSQYHAQDELGQYSYGYNGGLSAKAETKTFDGVTRGGYSYVDANGIVQKVDYTSDAINGFRVAATNLPVGPVSGPVGTIAETPEVVAAKAVHFAAHVEAKERLAKAL